MNQETKFSKPRPARSRILHGFAVLFGSFLLLLASPMSQADVWGYVDANGVGHYANTQVDPRYVLFFREKASAKDASAMKYTPLLPGRSVDVALNFGSGSAHALNAANSIPAMRLGTGLQAVAYFNKAANFKTMRKYVQLAAKANRVDVELLQAMIATESGFDHTAVSSKGAIGLMQLMPPTAERFGVTADAFADVPTKLVDPKTNIMAGASYLSYLLKMYPGQIELAIAAYNAGEGSVKSAGNQIPDFKETQNYVRSVLGLYASLKPGVTIPDLTLIGVKDPKVLAAAAKLRQLQQPQALPANAHSAAGRTLGLDSHAARATALALNSN